MSLFIPRVAHQLLYARLRKSDDVRAESSHRKRQETLFLLTYTLGNYVIPRTQ